MTRKLIKRAYDSAVHAIDALAWTIAALAAGLLLGLST
jgi:hypothetical protein